MQQVPKDFCALLSLLGLRVGVLIHSAVFDGCHPVHLDYRNIHHVAHIALYHEKTR